MFNQVSYGFEENPLSLPSISHDQGGHHMVPCIYQPNFHFMHQQANPTMSQLTDPSTNHNIFPSCIRFPQDSLPPSLYQEPASSSSHFG